MSTADLPINAVFERAWARHPLARDASDPGKALLVQSFKDVARQVWEEGMDELKAGANAAEEPRPPPLPPQPPVRDLVRTVSSGVKPGAVEYQGTAFFVQTSDMGQFVVMGSGVPQLELVWKRLFPTGELREDICKNVRLVEGGPRG